MILHLLTDDKFSDSIVKQFSAKEMLSDFVLLAYSEKMKHFHYKDKAITLINPSKESDLKRLLSLVSNYSSVVFHGFYHAWQAWLLNRWPKHVKIAWVCWGGEIYGQQEIVYTFLRPISKFAYWMYTKRHPKTNIDIFPRMLIEKADYCLTNMAEEYEFVKNYLSTDIRHLSFNYYTIEDTIGPLRDKVCRGKNIFLGNAATIDSNHLEALLHLKKVGIGDRQIVMPMSYGELWVRNIGIKVGRLLFGSKLRPIVDFLPLDEYNSLMLDCSVMIQPHLREHAHGNIMTGIWLGMRVYLSENCMDYNHFKSIGCKVYSIEKDLRRSNPNVFEHMSEEDITHNRQILLSVYGQEHIDATNRELVKELA